MKNAVLSSVLLLTLLSAATAPTVATAQDAGSHALPADPAEPGPPPDLTPMGAIRAGTANRFIPAWEGGLAAPVKGWEPDRPHPDPFFEDSHWFVVERAEIDRYKVRLSWGLRELLRRSERFEVPVYPGHRSAAAPLAVYNAAIENRRTAKLSENELVVTGARVAVPFPEPKSGAEAMWNHLLRWRGGTMVRLERMVLPDKYGKLNIRLFREDLESAYGLGEAGLTTTRYRRSGLSPDTVKDEQLLLIDSLDPLRNPRVAWFRAAGAPRAQRAGEFVAGAPDPATDGVRTADMLDMFSGPLDRFDFRLVGRRAMYAPYNAYRLIQENVEPEDFLWAEHPNPSFLRYELHRLWLVEAKLKRGLRHPYPERLYYLDEDSWQIVMADHFDKEYRLARYAEAHGAAFSHVPVFAPAMEITYDFIDNRYVVNGRDNRARPPIYGKPFDPTYFTREALEPNRRSRLTQ
jgi:hypothetical protein